MKTIELPGGVTAVIRSGDEMTERQRRVLRTALMSTAMGAIGDELTPDQLMHADEMPIKLTPELSETMFALRDATIVACLVSWSLDEPLPTLETVQDLPGAVYDALAAATEGALNGMTADFSPTPEPTSPTPPSSASDGPLRGVEIPTPTWSIGGGNTSTASSTT